MEDNKPQELQNIDSETEQILQPFFEKLNPKLEGLDISTSQIEAINKKIIEANDEVVENQANENDIASSAIENLINKFADNPEKFLFSFKVKWFDYAYDFGVVIVIVGALVWLSLAGHLEPSQTATIFAAIVGYVLGHYSR